mgnify:CR=1 FL=1
MIFSICSNWNYRELIITPTHKHVFYHFQNEFLTQLYKRRRRNQAEKASGSTRKLFFSLICLTFLQSCSTLTSALFRWSALAIQLRVLLKKSFPIRRLRRRQRADDDDDFPLEWLSFIKRILWKAHLIKMHFQYQNQFQRISWGSEAKVSNSIPPPPPPPPYHRRSRWKNFPNTNS